MKVNIVDSIMGSGKTQAAINYINQSSDDVRFIYITPYLEEVNRIISSCKSKNFKQPEKYNEKCSKLISIKVLLNKRENIATTHALFYLFDDEVIDLCYSQGYILIMDEVADVVSPYYIGETEDKETLLTKYVDVLDNGLLKWKDSQLNYGKNPNAKFYDERRLCDMECLAMYGKEIVIWLFPVKIFRAFREIYILTYLFNSQTQRYYYDYFNIEYSSVYIAGNDCSNYRFTNNIEEKNTPSVNYKELIHILDDPKLNLIGDDYYALSKAWYERNRGNALMKRLKNNTENFFRNKLTKTDKATGTKTTSKTTNNLWTTFKDYKTLVQGKGYTKGFIPSNMRATNEYKDRTAVAYLINKYFNPYVKKFFIEHGVEVDENGYAVSEMLQLLWRSAIRERCEITVYIPSRRMRELLINWIDENSSEETII